MSSNMDDDKDDKIVDFTGYKRKKAGENAVNSFIIEIVLVFIILAVIVGAFWLRNRSISNSNNKSYEEPVATAADSLETEADPQYDWWDERDTTEAVTIATSGDAEQQNEYDIGTRVLFGTYPQGANGEIEALSWQVLDKDDDYALLVSEYVLDTQAFSSDGVIQWENSELRAWLNDKFYNQAFSSEEKTAIMCFEIENEDNSMYNTSGGHDTDDLVFLLSLEDTEDYSDILLTQCRATPYAEKKGLTASSNIYTTYWLRSPGSSDLTDSEPGYAATIDSTGAVKYYGNDSTYENIGVRPAIWIKISE